MKRIQYRGCKIDGVMHGGGGCVSLLPQVGLVFPGVLQ